MEVVTGSMVWQIQLQECFAKCPYIYMLPALISLLHTISPCTCRLLDGGNYILLLRVVIQCKS
jgi:hypothetical protein